MNWEGFKKPWNDHYPMQNQEDRIYTPSIVQKSNEDREIYAAAAADFRESRRLEKRVFVIVYSRRSFVVNLAMNYDDTFTRNGSVV
jgi:hypothetical protein